MARRHDRAARRERVRGGAGRRGDDQAVGRVRGERRAVDRDLRRTSVPAVRFSSTASLSAHQRPARRPADSTRDREHHPLRDRVVAREQAVERGVELVGLDLGEVAELADVDAEDGDAGLVDELDRAQHRAVAAEADHQVEPVGERARVDREVREPDAVSLGSGTRTSTPCSASQSRGVPARARPRLGPLVVRDEPDAAARSPARPGPRSTAAASSTPVVDGARRRRAWTRNSTLPSAPLSGDTIDAADAEPVPGEPVARPRARTARCTSGSRTIPPLPDTARGPPRTAASPAARSRRRRSLQRDQRRRDRAQRDEREVGDARGRPGRRSSRRRGRARWCARAR